MTFLESSAVQQFGFPHGLGKFAAACALCWRTERLLRGSFRCRWYVHARKHNTGETARLPHLLRERLRHGGI